MCCNMFQDNNDITSQKSHNGWRPNVFLKEPQTFASKQN